MYSEDSFFTLSTGGQIGLLCVSAALTLLTLWGLLALCRHHSLLIRLALAWVTFMVFVWLAPQAYYFYYIYLFGTLAWQSVVSWPPQPAELFDLLLFRNRQNLSFHSQGLLGWLLMLAALLAPRLSRQSRIA